LIGKIRSIESNTTEVYVDVNDLIIELLLEVDKAQSEHEKKAYRSLISRLTEIRDKSHKGKI
jgi:hypothetical protein